jgi:FdhD protein
MSKKIKYIERDLTIYLNNQEIVTLMTVGDHPEFLAVGYLLNQNMLKKTDTIKKIEYDKDLKVIVVRTSRKTNYEEKLKRKITTSGCAVGTIFGDVYDEILKSKIKSKKKIKHSWIYEISKKINLTPSLYLEAGAIHGCAIIKENNPIIYMEDVGRHNAVDKIAGYMFLEKINGDNKIFYTTGRLTSEMVIKTVKMKIPILISRSGFTSWGVELARKTNLTLIGRAKGKKYLVLSGEKRIDHK